MHRTSRAQFEVNSEAQPAPNWSRRRRLLITALVFFIALYVGLIAAYAIGRARPVDQRAVAVPPGGVMVVLTARNIDALVIGL
jgi:hypothetical protein